MTTCAPLRMVCSCVCSFNAADHDRGADAGSSGELVEGLADLDRQFARGAQNQSADAGQIGPCLGQPL